MIKRIKKFNVGDSVRIDVDFLEKHKTKQISQKNKKEIEKIIKNKGITKIIDKKSGNIFIDGSFWECTQYMIEYNYVISPDHIVKKIGGSIPLSKVHKIRR